MANRITLIRLFMIPIFLLFLTPAASEILLISTDTTTIIATIIFLLAAATDKLDGYVARKYNQVTKLGKLLDPLVDKLLIIAGLIILVDNQKIASWMAFVIIGDKMNNSIFVDWGGQNIKLTWLPTDQLPKTDQVTSVHGICFNDNKIMLVHVKGRGFNVPGGHVDDDETLEQALHREVYEEGYVRGTITRFLGMVEVSHKENPLFDPNGKYPLVGYQLFYRMDITECLPFARENETIARIWVEPSEFPYVVNDHELIHLVVEEALTIVQGNRV